MNEYVILDENASVHTAWKAKENPDPRVLITTENDGEIVHVIGTNVEEVAGWRRYFDSDDWGTTRRQSEKPLDLWASRSESTMLAKRGDLDAEGDELVLEAAEFIRDALKGQASDETPTANA